MHYIIRIVDNINKNYVPVIADNVTGNLFNFGKTSITAVYCY
jgi:hypothetical protein